MTFREEPEFQRIREGVFGSDETYRLFQNELMANPEVGAIIPGGGGIRKTRWSDLRRGKGKRGGIRVIYYYVPEFEEFLLLYAYNKNTSDITPDERRLFRVLAHGFAQELKQERGRQ